MSPNDPKPKPYQHYRHSQTAGAVTKSITNVAVLGSTGSIGKSALEVISGSGGRLRAIGLSANRSLDLLDEQARRMSPMWIAATDAEAAARYQWSTKANGVELVVGQAGLEKAVARPEVDVVLAAIVGSAGLRSTWAALEAGKTVALANKETLVMAGPLAMELARARGARILPVDSEHSAVFQALQAGRSEELKRIVLTASGGPFRGFSQDELSRVTIADALVHPTWAMGKKITVDSATMMNKALEIIEARWLFGVEPEQISVVIHPQSVVHSFVEFVDGSVMAQLSPPDMRLPIQYALTYPDRQAGVANRLDWSRTWELSFEPPDLNRFPALEIGLEAARAGGTAGAVLNAANEGAVASFLSGDIPFTDIVPACRSVLEHHDFEPRPSLDRLIELDQWAREEVSRWVCT